MKKLDVKGPQVSHVNEDSDPIDIALNEYVGYPSTFKIKEYFNELTECNFSEVIPNDISDIWAKEIVRKGTFPKDLKNADVTPVFKKDNLLLAKNYKPVSVWPTVSKIFERIMQKKIIDYINQYFLPCFLDTEKASVYKRLCFISLKNEALYLIKKNTQVLS